MEFSHGRGPMPEHGSNPLQAAEWTRGKTIIESDCSTVIATASKPGLANHIWRLL